VSTGRRREGTFSERRGGGRGGALLRDDLRGGIGRSEDTEVIESRASFACFILSKSTRRISSSIKEVACKVCRSGQ
jgi:hypothetical protein